MTQHREAALEEIIFERKRHIGIVPNFAEMHIFSVPVSEYREWEDEELNYN